MDFVSAILFFSMIGARSPRRGSNHKGNVAVHVRESPVCRRKKRECHFFQLALSDSNYID